MRNKKSKKLFFAWVLSQVVFLLSCSIYVASHYTQSTEPIQENSIYSTLIILSVVLYSLPMLLVIQHFANKEQSKGILVASRVFIAFFLYWLLLYIF